MLDELMEMDEPHEPAPPVLECVKAALGDMLLTRGEILTAMNRLSLRPEPAHVSHGYGDHPTWDTLDHRERLAEIETALSSHPELFRDHGAGVGWTLRDDRPKAKAKVKGRKEAKMPGGKTTTTETRRTGRSTENVARPVCVHCDKSWVAAGKCSTSIAAGKLDLCSTCYSTRGVAAKRRKDLGLPAHGEIIRKIKPGREGRSPSLLPAPLPGTIEVELPGPPLRAEIGAVLRAAFTRFACDELRAIAQNMEELEDLRRKEASS